MTKSMNCNFYLLPSCKVLYESYKKGSKKSCCLIKTVPVFSFRYRSLEFFLFWIIQERPKNPLFSHKIKILTPLLFLQLLKLKKKSGLRISILWVKSIFLGHFWFLKKLRFFWKNQNPFFGHNFLPRHPNHLISSQVSYFLLSFQGYPSWL